MSTTSAYAITTMLALLAFTGAQAAYDLDSHPCDSFDLATIEKADACVDADTDPCSDREYGWGYQYPNCFFDCERNQYVHVKASVNNGGWVEADAACGGAYAHCEDFGGLCSAMSKTMTTTPTRTTGTCKATTLGGPYTNGYVSCWTTDAPEDGTFDLPDLKDGERPSVTTIFFEDGEATALVCRSGAGCREAVPTCVRVGDLQTCTVQRG